MQGLNWYYSRQDQAIGPIDLGELRRLIGSGEVLPADYVWNERLADWRRVSEVPGLLEPASAAPAYAGFWRRVLARLIDILIMAPLWMSLSAAQVGIAIWWSGGSTVAQGTLDTVSLVIDLGMQVVFWLYRALMESSRYQGTVGKIVLGIHVTDMHGRRIGFLHATGRFLADYINMFTLGLGYLIAALPPRKQALHDVVARTLVVMKPRGGEVPEPTFPTEG